MNNATKESNVLIFGGSFNPPTRAHQAIISAGLAEPGYDELWVMPSGERQDKHISTSDEQRLAILTYMKRQDYADNPRLIISDFELCLPRPTMTYRTIGALASRYDKINFTYVFGYDSYLAMPSWQHGEELQRSLVMKIVKRAGMVSSELAPRVTQLQVEQYENMSSTNVRALLTSGASVGHLVSESVVTYITAQKLFVSNT